MYYDTNKEWDILYNYLKIKDLSYLFLTYGRGSLRGNRHIPAVWMYPIIDSILEC